MQACESGQLAIASYLLQNGINGNKEEEYGNTPLILTASDGHTELVALLIEHKV